MDSEEERVGMSKFLLQDFSTGSHKHPTINRVYTKRNPTGPRSEEGIEGGRQSGTIVPVKQVK